MGRQTRRRPTGFRGFLEQGETSAQSLASLFVDPEVREDVTPVHGAEGPAPPYAAPGLLLVVESERRFRTIGKRVEHQVGIDLLQVHPLVDTGEM